MSFTPHLAQIAYASILRASLLPAELERLLSAWRVANARQAITGILLVQGRACFQVLEGFPDVVEALFTRIEHDRRHGHVVRLLHRQIEHRRFGDWSMKLSRAAPHELAAITGLEGLAASGGRLHTLDPAEAATLIEALSESLGEAARRRRMA